MNKKFKLIPSIILSFLVLFLLIGNATWVLANTLKISGKNATHHNGNLPFVCYINENVDGKKYKTIEKALEKANSGETVFVIPGANPTITRNCTIKAGVTLCLPYEGTTYFNKDAHGTSNTFSDNSTSSINTNRVTILTINENVTLSLEDKSYLNIGGVLAGPAQKLAGQTAGKYCEILMKNRSQIISDGGRINCFGYIKEDTENAGFISVENATVTIPFVIHDFKGGTATLGIENRSTDKFCPFEIFDFPNIQSKMRIYSSSFLKSYCQIYISSNETYYPENDSDRLLTVIGNSDSNTIFILKKGYIDIKHTPDTKGISKTFSNTDKTTDKIVINGECSIGSISITIKVSLAEKTIKTDNYFLPLCYRYKIHLKNNSVLNVNKNIKFMNGSEVIVDNGARISLSNSKIIFYESNFMEYEINEKGEAVYKYNKEIISKYPIISNSAQLINNGTIEVDSSSAIGGFIQTTKSTGSIIYNSSITSVASPESDGQHPSDGPTAILGKETGAVSYSLPLHLLLNNANTDVTIEQGNKFYMSMGSYWLETEANKLSFNIINEGKGTFYTPSYTIDILDENGDIFYTSTMSGKKSIQVCSNYKFRITNGEHINKFVINSNTYTLDQVINQVFEMNQTDQTVEIYAEKESDNIYLENIELTVSPSDSQRGKKTYTFTVNLIPDDAMVEESGITWEIVDKTGDAFANSTLTSNSGKTTSIKSSNDDGTATIRVTVTDKFGHTRCSKEITITNSWRLLG